MTPDARPCRENVWRVLTEVERGTVLWCNAIRGARSGVIATMNSATCAWLRPTWPNPNSPSLLNMSRSPNHVLIKCIMALRSHRLGVAGGLLQECLA
jgi:hypothetical protein